MASKAMEYPAVTCHGHSDDGAHNELASRGDPQGWKSIASEVEIQSSVRVRRKDYVTR